MATKTYSDTYSCTLSLDLYVWNYIIASVTMRILTRFILFLALKSGVHAVGEGPYQGWFKPVPEVIGDRLPVSPDLIVSHDQNPNVSRSATFKPFQNAWQALPEGSVLRNAEWTWRVNVSQFYAPYNGSGGTGPSDRQAFVSQTSDFSWTAKGNFSEALNNATGPFCVTQFTQEVDLPVNVTNALNTDDASCIPALGQACVNAILNRTPMPSEARGCNWGQDGPMFQLPECRSSLGRNRGRFGSFFGTGLDLGNASNQINSGDAFWVNVSGPVLGNETWLYDTVANQIQLFLFSTVLPTTQPGVTVHGKELICMRANTTKLPDIDVNKDGVATVGEVVLLSAGTKVVAGYGWFMYLGLMGLVAAVLLS
ncbi:hypothetical protein F4777DRAFT_216162 [Nemania sp. FL0916]|nr:hypothetical protein F4777DRAFT_216162 [Nemania sp. FL0916]